MLWANTFLMINNTASCHEDLDNVTERRSKSTKQHGIISNVPNVPPITGDQANFLVNISDCGPKCGVAEKVDVNKNDEFCNLRALFVRDEGNDEDSDRCLIKVADQEKEKLIKVLKDKCAAFQSLLDLVDGAEFENDDMTESNTNGTTDKKSGRLPESF